MQENKTLSRAEWLDKIFGTPVFAVLLAIFCNVLWGSAFPFIKLGYRLFSIDSGNTASIFCFAGVRFMLGSVFWCCWAVFCCRAGCPFPRAKWQRSAVLWVCGRPRPSMHSITSLWLCSPVPLAAS